MSKKTAPPDPVRESLKSFVSSIEGECDREAVRLILETGILAIDDPAKIHDAVERLAERKPTNAIEKWTKLNLRPETGAFIGPPQNVRDYFDLALEERTAHEEAAYLLGIAVGRRLGSAKLTIGGAR